MALRGPNFAKPSRYPTSGRVLSGPAGWKRKLDWFAAKVPDALWSGGCDKTGIRWLEKKH